MSYDVNPEYDVDPKDAPEMGGLPPATKDKVLVLTTDWGVSWTLRQTT